MKKLSVASLPEWSKGSDSRSFVLCTRGFKSHSLQIFFLLKNYIYIMYVIFELLFVKLLHKYKDGMLFLSFY